MDYLAVIKDLIALDTTVPPGKNYERAIDYLLPIFQSVGFTVEKIAIPPDYAEGKTDRFALVAHHRIPGRSRLIFYAHVDVVPATGWDAFIPRVEAGRIYGRGAADMKGGLVGMLLGLESVKGKALNYDVSAIVTTDEEYSQAPQLRYLAQFIQPVKGAYVFSQDSNFGFVSIAGLGLLQMNIRVKGKSAHSGLAHLGENAVEKATLLLQALLQLKSEVVQRKSRVPVHPSTGLTHMESRLNINIVHGGLKANIVPDSCIITVDRRLIPEENVAEAERELLETLGTVPGVNWEVESTFKIPTVPPCEGPAVDKLATVIREITGQTGRYGEMGSGDLAAIVAYEWGGQDFGMGVIRTESNIHGKDEFAYLKDIDDLGKTIARFLTA